MITTDLRTISYGHVLARQLRSCTKRLSPDARERVLAEIETRGAIADLTGETFNCNVFAYARDLLCGRNPKKPLGKNRKLKDGNR